MFTELLLLMWLFIQLYETITIQCPYAHPRKAEGNYHFWERLEHLETFSITKIKMGGNFHLICLVLHCCFLSFYRIKKRELHTTFGLGLKHNCVLKLCTQ